MNASLVYFALNERKEKVSDQWISFGVFYQSVLLELISFAIRIFKELSRQEKLHHGHWLILFFKGSNASQAMTQSLRIFLIHLIFLAFIARLFYFHY